MQLATLAIKIVIINASGWIIALEINDSFSRNQFSNYHAKTNRQSEYNLLRVCGAVCGCGGVEEKWNGMWNWWELSLIVQSNTISSSEYANGKKQQQTTKKPVEFFFCIHYMLRSMFNIQCVAVAIFGAAVALCRHLIFNIYRFVFCSSLFADIWITFQRFYDEFWFSIFLAMDIERCPVGDTDCIIRVTNAFVQVNGKSKFRDFQSNFHFQSNVFMLIRNFRSFRFSLSLCKEGHSGINLIPVDPLHIPSISIKQGADSPVNIELKFSEVDLIGLSNSRFTKLRYTSTKTKRF